MTPAILVTSFEPFNGETSNNSQLVMEGLVSRFNKQGFEAEGLVLPVLYDRAAEELQAYIQKFAYKHKRVLSLGEARGEARLETQAQNWDKNERVADNQGLIRKGQKIIEGEPEWVPLSAWWLAKYEKAQPEIKRKIGLSKDAGTFVCNNTAFRMAVWAQEHKIDYSFLHVPADKKNISMIHLLDLSQSIFQIAK